MLLIFQHIVWKQASFTSPHLCVCVCVCVAHLSLSEPSQETCSEEGRMSGPPKLMVEIQGGLEPSETARTVVYLQCEDEGDRHLIAQVCVCVPAV